MPVPPPDLDQAVLRLIDDALAEDIGPGDITCQAVIPPGLDFSGVMAAREDMVVAGLTFAARVFRRLSPAVRVDLAAEEGALMTAGGVLARISGPAGALLAAERTALNLLQHLSGIATLTRTYVDAIAGTGTILLDTRKTIPGLRLVEKYAARMGGAQNHRMGLYDGILIKDNHLAVCGGVTEAVRRARAASRVAVEVECDTLEQVAEAVAAGADIILLDNMPRPILAEAVHLVGGRAKTECSGGVTLDTIRALAETGVDYISVGRLTQSAGAVDIGLDWRSA
ncbi:MAG TPA: carboxylating nicotinate-nucleotide diphosphorylase [Rhodospirillaceae bacterium]|nr:carboxylating nicotinate-nucleotide diphosphorylase [Rhodospirillaceae bacterium]